MGHVRRNCPDHVLAGPKKSKGKRQGQSHVATIVHAEVPAEDSMGMVTVEIDSVDEAIG